MFLDEHKTFFYYYQIKVADLIWVTNLKIGHESNFLCFLFKNYSQTHVIGVFFVILKWRAINKNIDSNYSLKLLCHYIWLLCEHVKYIGIKKPRERIKTKNKVLHTYSMWSRNFYETYALNNFVGQKIP